MTLRLSLGLRQQLCKGSFQQQPPLSTQGVVALQPGCCAWRRRAQNKETGLGCPGNDNAAHVCAALLKTGGKMGEEAFWLI